MLQDARFHIHDGNRTLTSVECGHDRVLDAFLVSHGRFELVDDQFDEMGLVAVQIGERSEIHQFSINPHLGIAPFPHLVEKILVMALSSSDQRSQQITFLAIVPGHDQVYDLFIRIADHLFSRYGRIGAGGFGIEQTEEIEYFCNGAHCRTGIVSGRLLFNGDNRTESCNLFHFRFLESSHEMFGIGTQGVHVASLAFGVDGVESKRRLAASAQTGHDDKFVSRQRKAHVLEVVGFRTCDFNIFFFIHVFPSLLHPNPTPQDSP